MRFSKNLDIKRIDLTFVESEVIYFFYFLDVYLPKEPYFDATFFLQWLGGNKKVNLYNIIYIVNTARQAQRLFFTLF